MRWEFSGHESVTYLLTHRGRPQRIASSWIIISSHNERIRALFGLAQLVVGLAFHICECKHFYTICVLLSAWRKIEWRRLYSRVQKSPPSPYFFSLANTHTNTYTYTIQIRSSSLAFCASSDILCLYVCYPTESQRIEIVTQQPTPTFQTLVSAQTHKRLGHIHMEDTMFVGQYLDTRSALSRLYIKVP